MKLSVVIITLNEEKYIKQCLTSVKKIADEIIVVDSGSTDNTIEIAKKFGAKVYTRVFDNYSNQKNFAAQKAAGEWILSLDGDEEVSPELAEEIKTKILDDSFAAYSIPRKNIILGKFIKYTRWQPELDRHVWLWKKDAGKWEGRVHEELKINGKVGKLKHHKIHYQYGSVSNFLVMMNKYSSLETKGDNPIYHFLVRYFYRLGFLDDSRGFILSYLMAIYHLVVWVKKWEKRI